MDEVLLHGQAASDARSSRLPAGQKKLNSLQWLRYVAALFVVFYHAAGHLKMVRGSDWGIENTPDWLGPVGVTIFFALSGNLMASAMMRQKAPQFLLHRVVRIYPAFFLCAILTIGINYLIHGDASVDWRAMSLMPYGGSGYPLGVEWTLVFEIVFYVFVAGIIALNKQAEAVSILVGWLALIVINCHFHPDDPTTNVFPPPQLLFQSINVAFATGMLFPLIIRFPVHPILAFLIAVALVLITPQYGIVPMRWGYGFGAALFVLSLSRYRGLPALFGDGIAGRLGNRLGNASYALYLCHVPILRLTYFSFWHVHPQQIFFVAIAFAITGSLVIGALDVWMYARLKGAVDRGGHWVPPAAAAFLAVFAAVATWSTIYG